MFTMIHCPKRTFYHMRASVLSAHWAKQEFLQLDLLEDSSSIRERPLRKNVPLHALLIKNYNGLMVSFKRIQGHHQRNGSSTEACRNCGKMFKDPKSMKEHSSTCNNPNSKNTLGRRKITNTVRYIPTSYCARTQKVKKNYLKFEKRNFHSTLPPLAFFFADWEARNISFDETLHESEKKGVPKTAIFSQEAMGYSITLGSPYPQIQVPVELKGTTVRILDDENGSPKDLYLDLLYSIKDFQQILHQVGI